MRCQRFHARIYGVLFVTSVVALPDPTVQAADDSFTRVIRPLLACKCFASHGPDASKRQANLQLDQRSTALESGALIPG